LASIVKVLIAFENKCIPANLHFKKLKHEIAEMSPPLFPINENFDYEPGI
jgi:acyl transferase domain-containing protein